VLRRCRRWCRRRPSSPAVTGLFNGSVDGRLGNAAPAGLRPGLAGEALPFSVGACGELALEAQAIALRERIDLLKNLAD
jgi:hypothetical protein